MLESTNFDSRSFVNDPLNKNVRPYEKSLQSHEWNEYQKLSGLNALEVSMPDYLTRYQSTKLVKLAGVKRGIFNPLLPTIKQMQRDSLLGKLPDEHCRTTSTFSKDEFEKRTFYINKPPVKDLYSLNYSIAGKKLLENSAKDVAERQQLYVKPITPQANTNTANNNNIIENLNLKADLYSGSLDTFATNYAARIKNPDISRGWRFHLNDNKTFDKIGRVPASHDKINQFRDTRLYFSRHMQPISAKNARRK